MANEGIRIDKWLWTARFFKTRSLASDAVNGGKVHLNGQRVKAGRAVKTGDVLSIQKDTDLYEITIKGINKTRRPAKEARLTYDESEDSRSRREQEQKIKKLAAASRPVPQRKPGKREREQLRQFKHKG
jgi:ribosome-associated heat shock protein Hsp15